MTRSSSASRILPPPVAQQASDLDVRRPLRADAEHNRRLILDAAGAVFAERGLGAGFDEIARVAGVGVATVYRRFPERDDLIDALFAYRIQAMVTLAVAAADISDPWQSLVWFLEKSISAQAADRGLAEVMGDGLRGRQRLEVAQSRMRPAVGLLIDRARAAGVLRDGIEVLDLAILGRMLAQILSEANPGLWRRYLAIAVDGLRPPAANSLAPGPPTESDLASIAHRR